MLGLSDKEYAEARHTVHEAINDDLNLPRAIAALHQANSYKLWLEFDTVLGLDIEKRSRAVRIEASHTEDGQQHQDADARDDHESAAERNCSRRDDCDVLGRSSNGRKGKRQPIASELPVAQRRYEYPQRNHPDNFLLYLGFGQRG